MSEKERGMSDIREALVARQREEFGESWDVLVPEVGWTLGRIIESTIEDVLAEFDVTERGPVARGLAQSAAGDVLDLGDFTQYAAPDSGEDERDDSCGYCGRVHSDFAACFEDATVTPTAHDHKWQRRQNVTSSGYRMPPYEVCVVDGCDAARPVDEPAALTPATLPSVGDVARACGDPGSVTPRREGESVPRWSARAVLALLPGRTEAEVKAEALREAAIYAPGGPVVSGWLRERADQWEETNRG